MAIPGEEARRSVESFNAARAQFGWPDREASYQRYLSCRHCGAPAAKFVPGAETDARAGVTMQPCVIKE